MSILKFITNIKIFNFNVKCHNESRTSGLLCVESFPVYAVTDMMRNVLKGKQRISTYPAFV